DLVPAGLALTTFVEVQQHGLPGVVGQADLAPVGGREGEPRCGLAWTGTADGELVATAPALESRDVLLRRSRPCDVQDDDPGHDGGRAEDRWKRQQSVRLLPSCLGAVLDGHGRSSVECAGADLSVRQIETGT